MKKSLLIPFIVLVVLATAIGVYYLYKNSINKADLMDDIKIFNQKKAILVEKFTSEITQSINSLPTGNISQFNNFTVEIDNIKNNFIDDLESLRDDLKTSMAQEYMDNFIERQKLKIDMAFSLALTPSDIMLGNGYNNEEEIIKEYEDKLKQLNEVKKEMEKDFSKIIKQPVILD